MTRKLSLFLEHQISNSLQSELHNLLQNAFPGYFEKRHFHKQLPTFRLLIKDGGTLIGHVGVIHRVISMKQKPLNIFGVLDLCVHPQYRQQGVGSQLMNDLIDRATQSDINHIMLFADHNEQGFYHRFGFDLIQAQCRWLAIEGFHSHSVLEQSCKDILMIRSRHPEFFQGQTIDLLGELF